MAEYHNNVFIITRDNRRIPGPYSEFQKCSSIDGQCVCEQCEFDTFKSKRSVCPIKLNTTTTIASQRQPTLPIEPILKVKAPISFINDMIRRDRRSIIDEPQHLLKSHIVHKFRFPCDDADSKQPVCDPQRNNNYDTHCFTTE